MTILCHEWLKVGLEQAPPSVRDTFTKLAGLEVEWDAPETLVRPRTIEENQAIRARRQREGQQMQESANALLNQLSPRSAGW